MPQMLYSSMQGMTYIFLVKYFECSLCSLLRLSFLSLERHSHKQAVVFSFTVYCFFQFDMSDDMPKEVYGSIHLFFCIIFSQHIFLISHSRDIYLIFLIAVIHHFANTFLELRIKL